MAATFIVEDGTGLANANSFASVAEADQYHENYANPATWTALTTAQKQDALRKATQFIEAEYSARVKGDRAVSAQALSMPRRGLTLYDGTLLSETVVPARWKDACSYLAHESTKRELGVAQLTPGAVASETKTLGALSKSVSYGGSGRSTRPSYPTADGLLREYLYSGGEILLG